MKKQRPSNRKRAAFTLVEVAAAVAILAIVCTGLLLARTRAVQATGRAGRILTAVRLCASRVAALRAGLAEPGSGRFQDPQGYQWTIAEEPPPDDAPRGLRAFSVSVSSPTGEPEEEVRVAVWLFGQMSREESP